MRRLAMFTTGQCETTLHMCFGVCEREDGHAVIVTRDAAICISITSLVLPERVIGVQMDWGGTANCVHFPPSHPLLSSLRGEEVGPHDHKSGPFQQIHNTNGAW